MKLMYFSNINLVNLVFYCKFMA